ncbi:hypothetical protein QR680_018873 [Steinernema hermaphroditum]|uniref:GATA-type domain-containing protein n=1 Tax=Steinernema hermaphroditum TaxID=289476 RepID=A0AA39LR03_9BILA|nr:hypothetical protein QR680_018873 [Steinernema hermaphroditum]
MATFSTTMTSYASYAPTFQPFYPPQDSPNYPIYSSDSSLTFSSYDNSPYYCQPPSPQRPSPQICSICKTTNSGQWSFLDSGHVLCSTCSHGQIRHESPPAGTLSAPSSPQLAQSYAPFQDASPKALRKSATSNRICSNCRTSQTPLWRRSVYGVIQCNACSQYERKNGHPRPPALYNKPQLKRRRYKPKYQKPDDAVCRPY